MIKNELFMKIMKDKSFYDLKKMQIKYGENALSEVVELLKLTVYKQLPILDFNGINLVVCPSQINVHDDTYKILLNNNLSEPYSITQMQDEIESTLAIENITSSRNSIRNILQGAAPETSEENKIYGIKKGLDFISDKGNVISEANLYSLYMISVGCFLSEKDKLLKGNFYRHDNVYVVGDSVSHEGIKFTRLVSYMKKLIDFINSDDSSISIIVKSVVVHFYLAYLHPYFDGNGRMARLLQLWYLLQNDFNATLLYSFSKFISDTKNQYYKAFEIVEGSQSVSGVIDVTYFVKYFNNNVFNKLKFQKSNSDVIESFRDLIHTGKITVKEKELYTFVLSNYAASEFSTKQLEMDFKNAAYATIRAFVIKFTELGLLSMNKYGNRARYRVTPVS